MCLSLTDQELYAVLYFNRLKNILNAFAFQTVASFVY
jgi:hypothetical protein